MAKYADDDPVRSIHSSRYKEARCEAVHVCCMYVCMYVCMCVYDVCAVCAHKVFVQSMHACQRPVVPETREMFHHVSHTHGTLQFSATQG
jgi:hypothetical protein